MTPVTPSPARRRLLRLLCACAAAPLGLGRGAAAAPPSGRQYRIVIVSSGPSFGENDPRYMGMVRRLADRGYELGRNLVVERGGGELDPDKLAALCRDAIASKADVLVTFGYPAAAAAK